MVTVMKLEKAPQESYADIGGLDKQIMEIKVEIYLLYLQQKILFSLRNKIDYPFIKKPHFEISTFVGVC